MTIAVVEGTDTGATKTQHLDRSQTSQEYRALLRRHPSLYRHYLLLVCASLPSCDPHGDCPFQRLMLVGGAVRMVRGRPSNKRMGLNLFCFWWPGIS